jgi:hypothetical protein
VAGGTGIGGLVALHHPITWDRMLDATGESATDMMPTSRRHTILLLAALRHAN